MTRAVGLDASAMEVIIQYDPSDASGAVVSVEIIYNHELFVGKMLNLPPLSLAGRASMTVL